MDRDMMIDEIYKMMKKWDPTYTVEATIFNSIPSKIMEYILEYFNEYSDNISEYELFLKLSADVETKIDEELSEWDNIFFNRILAVSKYKLWNLMDVANDLYIRTLYEKICKFYAQYIEKNKMNIKLIKEFFDLEESAGMDDAS